MKGETGVDLQQLQDCGLDVFMSTCVTSGELWKYLVAALLGAGNLHCQKWVRASETLVMARFVIIRVCWLWRQRTMTVS